MFRRTCIASIIFSPGGHFVHWSETVLAFLVERHLGNILVKFD